MAEKDDDGQSVAKIADAISNVLAADDSKTAPPIDTLPAVDETLDADIAAELSAPAKKPPQKSPPQKPKKISADSALGVLSKRMQRTLDEIRSGHFDDGGAARMFQELTRLQEKLVNNMQAQISQFEEESTRRRNIITHELEELDAHGRMVRDEIAMQIAGFEAQMKELQERHTGNAESDRARLERYREFLQFLLQERNH